MLSVIPTHPNIGDTDDDTVGWVAAGMGVTDQVNQEVGLHKGWSMPLPPLSSLPSQTPSHLHLK